MSKNYGIGVVIRMLGGNEDSARAFSSCIGKTISALKLEDDALHFVMDGGVKMKVVDNGQSCWERRYMMTDDRLEDFVGATLLGAEIKDAPDIGNEDEVHEVQFLDVATSKGVFTMASHNEHNGYYGGFSIECILEN